MAFVTQRDGERRVHHAHTTSFPLDPIASSLVQLGLSRTEARVYLTVLRLRRASARAVARDCSMDAPAAYRAVEGLVGNGLLSLELGVPNVYVAVNLQDCVKQLLGRVREEVDSKTRIADELLLDYSYGDGNGHRVVASEQSDDTTYRLFTNRKALAREGAKRFSQVNNEVLIVHSAADNVPLVNLFFNLIKETSGRNVVWRIITEVDKSNLSAIKTLSRYCEVRCHRGVAMRFALLDKRTAVLGVYDPVRHTEEDYEPYIVVTNPSLANAMTVFFESLWRTSSKLDLARAIAECPQTPGSR